MRVLETYAKSVSYKPIHAGAFNNNALNNAWVEERLADARPEFYGAAFREWQGIAVPFTYKIPI